MGINQFYLPFQIHWYKVWRKVHSSFYYCCFACFGVGAFKIYMFIYLYLFWPALGFPCFSGALSSCSEQGLLFTVVSRLLIAVASPVAEHKL